MSTEKKAATGSAIVIIIIVAVLAIMGWSYMTDGDLNPFDNRTVASAQFGDTEIEIEDQGNGTMEMNVDE
tara:strand:- start:47 stop:256 length:210 start_codon:yes stop_codon:yes gene_type:complete